MDASSKQLIRVMQDVALFFDPPTLVQMFVGNLESQEAHGNFCLEAQDQIGPLVGQQAIADYKATTLKQPEPTAEAEVKEEAK